MNIGIDVRELCVSNTGIGQYTRNLLNYLFNNSGTHNFFLFSNNGAVDCKSDNFKFVKREKNNFAFDLFELPKLIKSNNIDIYFSPYYKMPLFSGRPAFITVHDIGFITFPIQFYGRSRFYRLFASKYLEFSLKRSAHIFAVSQFTKSEIIQTYNIDEKKITVLYNTINPVFDISLKKNKEAGIKKIHAEYGSFILSVSNYKPHKNIKSLINTFDRIKNEIQFNLLLAGPYNKGMNECRELVEKLKLNDRVFFTMPADNNELSILYAAAEIYCHPSMYEGFGLPPVEAQKCGCPVISSDAASLKEILADSALLFDYKNEDEFAGKLKTLCADLTLRNKFTEKGLINCGRFEPQKIYPEFINIIEKYLK